MIALYRGKSLFSRLIRWATWSEYSHAAWLDDDTGRIVEAWRRGVVDTTLGGDHTPGTRVDCFAVEGEDHAHRTAIRSFLWGEMGKPYDLRGVLGFVTRRSGAQSPARWFCSELVFAAYALAGIPILARVAAHQVPPGWLAMSPRLAPAYSILTQERAAPPAPDTHE
jgi:uncharacterized protein YycO